MAVAKPKALECPNCGSAVELRTMGRSISAVCGNCLSVIDTSNPSLQILGKFNEQLRMEPMIPLGRRGKVRGDAFEAAGFQDRYIYVEGDAYHWQEYLLFNPFKGFRYLTHYNGHWNLVKPISDLPEPTTKGAKKAVIWKGEVYTHFQSASAQTGFVLGEFPWRVKVDDTVQADDYTMPPRSLSSETTEDEVTWSAGEYIDGKEVWQSFNLAGDPPSPQGVYFNQPSPHRERAGATWRMFWLLSALTILTAILTNAFMGQKEVFSRDFSFQPGTPTGQAAFVTPVFDMTGRTTNVEISTRTDLSSNWTYFNYSLINERTGQTFDTGRMISSYSGDGSPNDSVLIGGVPAGRYSLRIEPEWQPDPSIPRGPLTPLPAPVRYKVMIVRDVPVHWPALLIIILLAIPPLFRSMAKVNFEASRWRESDYGGS